METTTKKGGYTSRSYWRKRSDALYYNCVDYVMRTVAKDARSLIDVGTGNCPYLEWFDWIPERVSVDINVPYDEGGVRGIVGDIHEIDFGKRFDVCTCLQVLEHVPDAKAFARRLQELADLLIVSVPYKWTATPVRVPGHVNDPVDEEKLAVWMGREANYRIIVEEPFSPPHRARRLVAIYDRDPERTFGTEVRDARLFR